MGPEVFRLNQPLNVVHLNDDGKGERLTLRIGSYIQIVRDSLIVPGFVEITCDGTLYSAFEQDLRTRSSSRPHG
jgi:hypothetical protein